MFFDEQKMISLYINDGVAYVWNATDWYTLRSQYRICGSFIGSLPSFPRQNDFLGLPVALMTEEAALLVEKGICDLYELPHLTEPCSENVKKEIIEASEKVVSEQRQELKKRKIEQLSQKIEIIMAGKKQKLLSKGITDVELDKEVLLQEEINKLPELASAFLLVHTPTEHYMKTAKTEVTTDALKNLKSNKTQVKCAIYKDLWEKQNFVTCGSKFGCDFLVYPGDPVKFHASHMVRCVADSSTTFHPASLVAFGRLAVAVNKLAVLAVRNDMNVIKYQTLQWHDSVNG